jgi:hypothetical protein
MSAARWSHYYNEHNAYRAAVLRERMAEGLLPKGVVDERDMGYPSEWTVLQRSAMPSYRNASQK